MYHVKFKRGKKDMKMEDMEPVEIIFMVFQKNNGGLFRGSGKDYSLYHTQDT